MQMHNLHLENHINTTKYNSLLDHVWRNVPSDDSKDGTTKSYWHDYDKSTYLACKLPNHISIYNIKN
jgi:hypothetical protein